MRRSRLAANGPWSAVLLLVGFAMVAPLWCSTRVGAAVTLSTLSGDLLLDCPTAYTPVHGSELNFTRQTGYPIYLGNYCSDKDVLVNPVPPPGQGWVPVFLGDGCDETVPLARLRAAGYRGPAIQLYGSQQTSSPYDTPVRYAYDPRDARQGLFVSRVHGSDSSQFLAHIRSLNATTGTNMSVVSIDYTEDPWTFYTYRSPLFLTYNVIMIFFFCIYVPQHAIRSLLVIRAEKRGRNAVIQKFDLQTVMMWTALVLGLVRIAEYATQITRDYLLIWSPEIISQLAWGYGYILLLASLLWLVFYWSELLNTTAVKLSNISYNNMLVLFGLMFCMWAVMTGIIIAFVFELPGSAAVKNAGFVLLGSAALLEGLGTVAYGGRIVMKLRDVRDMADRGHAPRQVAPARPSLSSKQVAKPGNAVTPALEPIISQIEAPEEGSNPGSDGGMVSSNPLFSPSSSSTTTDPAAPETGGPSPTRAKRASVLGSSFRESLRGLASVGLSPKAAVPSSPTAAELASERANELAAKKQRMALKRAYPMTRLVVVTGVLLLCAMVLSLCTAFTTVLLSPYTYTYLFFSLMIIEISIYVLVLTTMSPIWQRRRKIALKKQASSAAFSEESQTGLLKRIKQMRLC